MKCTNTFPLNSRTCNTVTACRAIWAVIIVTGMQAACGQVDELRIYSRALSGAEIHSLATGSGLTPDSRGLIDDVVLPDAKRVGGEPRPWSPEQATGVPDTPNRDDAGTAWSSATADGDQEWLLLEYAQAVRPKALLLFESSNEGAVTRVTVVDADGEEVEVWSGRTAQTESRRYALPYVIPLDTGGLVNKVRIHVDSPSVSGWNQIDAVGLRDLSGADQWAIKATASSTRAAVED